MEIKHQTYCPQWAGLAALCASMEKAGFMLSHIVPSHAYEAVAVFVRPGPEERETVVDSSGGVREADENGRYL